ncbi:tetratricopeptide repeat protein, partial [bacterium]|nr:tetratricopeptide repeat protein [bacterium]
LGLAYAKMRNYGKAIHYTKKALEMNPKSIMIQMQLSRFYLYNKQNDKARDILFPVVEEHPKLAEAHFQLGIAALNENQYQKALEFFEQTKEWLPDMPGLDERIEEAKEAL